MKFSIIVACNELNGGIGYEGKIPWKIPEDTKLFRKITENNIIVMGRLTWESLPIKPLPKRKNIIITSHPELYNNKLNENLSEIETFDSLDSLINSYLKNEVDNQVDNQVNNQNKEIFIIGGQQLYSEALKHPMCNKIYLSLIKNNEEYKFDRYFPIDEINKNNFIENEKVEYKDFTYIIFCKNNK